MATTLGLSAGAQANLAAAANALTDRGVIVPGGNVAIRQSPQIGFDEAHQFNGTAFASFPTLADMANHWQKVRLSIPLRAERRRIYFALWFDALTSARAAGSLDFLLSGNTVFQLPFDVSRGAAAAASTGGLSLPSFSVRRMDNTDTASVMPSSLSPGTDLLSVGDYSATLRYVTTMSPLRMRLAADTLRLTLWAWSVSNDAAGTFCVHLGVASDS